MMLSMQELKQLFEKSEVDLRKLLRGSGVTACHTVLAARLCGTSGVSVYDPGTRGGSSSFEDIDEKRTELPPAFLQTLVMAAQTRSLVSGQWLADAIRNKLVGSKLRILDASWYLPKTKRNPREEFAQRHIPGSSYFDIDECCDKSSAFDHMLPTSSHFCQYVGDLGIGNDTHVVVYDTSDFGAFSAPRVWWMFRLFGHNLVSLLDGGFKNWQADGYPVTSEYLKPERREFEATLNQAWVKSYEDVLENIRTKQVQVVDTRSSGRFKGTEPEPRDDILPGHYPGAINIPFTSFLDASGKEKEAESLAKIFKEAGVDLERPLWASCGSGVTACHVVLAAHLLGHPGVCVYDGSWCEWFQKASPEHVISEGEGKKV